MIISILYDGSYAMKPITEMFGACVMRCTELQYRKSCF